MSDQLQLSVEQRLQWARENPTLCIAPYATIDVRHSEFHPDGIYKTCCCNLDARVFDKDSVNVQDPFAEIKQQQLAGEWPSACFRCKNEEDHGGQSERIVGFLMYPEDRLQTFITEQKLKDFEIRIKFSNLCNLACRSCSPTESSTFAKITNATVESAYEVDISDSQEHWDFITATIQEKLPVVEHFYVHFIGGESLIQPGMHRLIDWMIDLGLAPYTNLRLTTAMTVNPNDELLSKLTQFKTIDINLSIDSVGENYQYVRWPVKFEKVITNLETLLNYGTAIIIKNGKKIITNSLPKSRSAKWNCVLTPVFSLNNIFYINDWIDYWNTWFQEKGYSFLTFNVNLTGQTNHLDVEALPAAYRAALATTIDQCLQHEIFVRYPNHTRALYSFLLSTLEELETMPENPELWRHFLSHTAFFDKKTNQSFAKFNSRLYNILTDSDRELFESLSQQVNTQNSLVQEVSFLKKINVQS
jgi:hypothetical protein